MTPTDANPEAVEVVPTQADREAGGRLVRIIHAYARSQGVETIGHDRVDDDGDVVKAFARHRISATAQLTAERDALRERCERLEVALRPFADCADELDGSEDVPRAPDGEWAKFRLLTDDYRRARAALASETRHGR